MTFSTILHARNIPAAIRSLLCALVFCFIPVGTAESDPGKDGIEAIYELVLPLIDQGRKHYFLGEYWSAIASLRHAQLLLHSEAGVDTEMQLNLIHWLALCYLVTGQVTEVDRQLHLHLLVSKHTYGQNGDVTLESLLQLADWHVAINETDTARELYRQAESVYALHRDHVLGQHLLKGQALNEIAIDRHRVDQQALIHEHFIDWLSYFYDVPIEQSLVPQTEVEIPYLESVILVPVLK